MSDDFTIPSQWDRPSPAEKLRDSKGSVVVKEDPHKRKEAKKDEKSNSDSRQEEEKSEPSRDSDARSGKIVDILI